MKKKISVILIMLAAMVLGGAACFASVIPPQGQGQIGLSSVVLCDSLSLHSEPSYSSASIQTLKYGSRIIVMSRREGWAQVVTGDSEDSPSGWVDEGYIAVDPSWYRTEKATFVYAWDDTSAPKVALLDEGVTLPILRDDGNWIIVSLRGAAGWISNPDRGTSQSSNTGGNSQDSAQNHSGSTSGGSIQDAGQWSGDAFTVYAQDGRTAYIHAAGGAMYEDAQGRTYVSQEEAGFYYCIATDTMYAFDPGAWTGEAYGENEFPSEDGYTGIDYGENPDWTGEDYGENPDWSGVDFGENDY